jgi:hypothetical protein
MPPDSNERRETTQAALRQIKGEITDMNNTNTYRFPARIRQLSNKVLLNRRWKSALLAGLMMLAVVRAASGANTGSLSFTPVDKCGTIIGAPGSYALTQNLESTSAVMPCIEITSPGVIFTLAGHTISGSGGIHAVGPGIRIFASAAGVQLLGNGAAIQGFNVGILNEASGVSIIGTVEGITVQKNSAQGILISDASSVVIENLNINENGAAGLELSHASGVIVQGTILIGGNGGYGLWLHSSSGNQFFGVECATNKLAGIYLGEPDSIAVDRNPGTGPVATDGNSAPSQDNIFVRGAVINNSGAGIAIGSGDYHNVIANMYGQSNGDKDAVDENGTCGANKWWTNEFTTTAPNCIQ